MSEEGGVVYANGIWKWVAAILVAIILAGAPGMVQAIKAPTKDEVNLLRDRQVQILIRLAAIDEQLQANQTHLIELQEALMEHQRNMEEQLGGTR